MEKNNIQQVVNHKSGIIKRIILYSCTLLCMAAIFYFSSQNQVTSAALSDKIVKPVMDTVEHTEIVDRKFDIFDYFNFSERIRDVMHFLEYSLLGILVWLSLRTFKLKRTRLISVLFCALYACTDEIHQIFVQGRGASVSDVLIDVCGSFVGIIVCSMILNHSYKRKHNLRA